MPGDGKKLYICVGMVVVSQNDGQEHYVNAHKVARLYGLHRAEKEGRVRFMDGENPNDWRGYRAPEGVVVLYPRYDGKYEQMEPHDAK